MKIYFYNNIGFQLGKFAVYLAFFTIDFIASGVIFFHIRRGAIKIYLIQFRGLGGSQEAKV